VEGRDVIVFSSSALRGNPLRSVLSMLGIAIGVAAVVLLTSLGEGARRYIVTQFSQFGTNVLILTPGKVHTHGVPGALGGTTRKLTIDDAEALKRLPEVQEIVPLVMGQARVEGAGRARNVFVNGATAELPTVWNFEVGQGQFLPPGDPRRGGSVAVLGPRLKRELFDDENALGEFVRVAGTRFRVIGVMAPKGRMLGFDLDDTVYVPLTTAMQIFNLDEVAEIDVAFAHEGMTDQVVRAVRALLTDRHGGNEDFTITTQTAMLEVFGRVMDVITLSVAIIAGISLLVGAIGIFTMMWISVGERVSEIGLLRAVGATAEQVHRLFLLEALLLTLTGGLVGLFIGLGGAALLRAWVEGLPVYTPPEYIVAAIGMSLVAGLVSGVGPARRAASLEPVEALRTE
jgi:putative ABC transport system permease protein